MPEFNEGDQMPGGEDNLPDLLRLGTSLQQEAPAEARASKVTHRRIAISVFDAALR